MTVANPLHRFRPALCFGALVLLILGIEHAVTTSAPFRQQPVLPYAVAFDLLVGIPALFYGLVVRRYRLPLSSIAGVAGACFALAHWLLPVAQQTPLQAVRFLPALLEGATLVLLIAKSRQLVQRYQIAYRQHPHFGPSAQVAVQQVLGRAGVLLVAEAAMLRYAVLGWWAQPAGTRGATAFSTHRDSGFTAFAVVLGAALVIESAAVHLLVGLWSARAAGWLLLCDLYLLLLLIAHAHAVRLRPVRLTADTLHLNVGFVWQLTVPLRELVAVESLPDHPEPAADLLNLTKVLFTPPNLLLTFAQPVTVKGPYGMQRTGQRVAVYLDHPQQFTEATGHR